MNLQPTTVPFSAATFGQIIAAIPRSRAVRLCLSELRLRCREVPDLRFRAHLLARVFHRGKRMGIAETRRERIKWRRIAGREPAPPRRAFTRRPAAS